MGAGGIKLVDRHCIRPWCFSLCGWLSCALQFPGTVLFNFNTFHAMIPGLNSSPPAFDFVLYAEEDPMSNSHQARVLVGNEGSKRVEALMEEQKE